MNILDDLNPEQKKAVMHDKGPLLILAGAGSGKTRVLTYRAAYLIEHRNVNPWNILAVTFTNKAAREMKERIDRLVGYGSENIWVSTFHSTCVRILRRFIDRIGYERSFSIYDDDDSRALMRDVCKYLDIDTKRIPEKSILNAISRAKDELIGPEEFEKNTGRDYMLKKQAEAYYEYQKRLKASNALDFDDLIFKTVELFMTDESALAYYQNRFQYIMVDEYQDTNTAQFRLIQLLASGVNEYGEREYNLCVVGDDDQSIYKFRGANIQNILSFERAFPNTKVIKLEQNYRSTKSILSAANEVIANNIGRKPKTLWTANEQGEPVTYTLFDTDMDEAESVTGEIKRMVDNNQARYNDFAILYRTNAQSRMFEEKLIRKNIPYKIIGSVNFYARKEIKDLLAYMKTIDNGLDNIAVKRIINVPRRGIGAATIEKVDAYAINNGMSFYDALVRCEQIPGLERSCAKIMSFVSIIEGLRSRLYQENYNLTELIDDILDATGYLKELEEEGSDEARERIANIDELVNKLVTYADEAEEAPTLSGFLEEVALVSDIDSFDESEDYLVLMTLHSAKGLEFPYVYICGMEEGIFPSYMAMYSDNPQDEIEEERRLCYVGITRARKRLSLTAARQRMMRGDISFNKPSRFIKEIPEHLLKINMPDRKTMTSFAPDDYQPSRMNYKPFAFSEPKQFAGNNLGELEYGVGDTVRHFRFGLGKVTAITMGGRDYEVTVDFEEYGTKKLMASFAKLTKAE
ncbi:MAG: DNA helicase PcrA [Clostridiales bacterium]|mgnify:FL=1|nr:DNA helicase PcrA [Clostridiales bacterium]